MRGELETKEKEIENLNFEVKNAGDNYSYLAKETAQLQKDYHHYKSISEGLAGVKSDLEGEILKLDDKINNYRIELLNKDEEIEEKEKAIANLTAKLTAGDIKQLSLFPPEPMPTPEPELTQTPEPVTAFLVTEPEPTPEPTPTPEPEPEIVKPESTPKPEPNPEQTDIIGTLTRGELLKYILENFPDSGMEDHNIGDAVAGKTKRLSEFEAAYGFKYLGKIKGKNRFRPNSNP